MNKTQHVNNLNYDAGAHMTFSGKISRTVKNSVNKGMYATQFFMGSPRSYKRCKVCDSDIKDTIDILKRFPTSVITHFPYIANLAGSTKQLAWCNDITIDAKLTNILSELSYELSIVSNFSSYGTSGVVIHPGSYPDRNIGHKTVAKSINKIKFVKNSKLLLENCAGEGNKLCKTFKELASVLSEVDYDKQHHIGICVDTAHIWGQGDYDISTICGVDKMFDEFDEHLGLDKFSVLHLNDSKVRLGSKKDAHENIGQGYIWGTSTKSLVHLLDRCHQLDVPMILETCPEDILKISIL